MQDTHAITVLIRHERAPDPLVDGHPHRVMTDGDGAHDSPGGRVQHTDRVVRNVRDEASAGARVDGDAMRIHAEGGRVQYGPTARIEHDCRSRSAAFGLDEDMASPAVHGRYVGIDDLGCTKAGPRRGIQHTDPQMAEGDEGPARRFVHDHVERLLWDVHRVEDGTGVSVEHAHAAVRVIRHEDVAHSWVHGDMTRRSTDPDRAYQRSSRLAHGHHADQRDQ